MNLISTYIYFLLEYSVVLIGTFILIFIPRYNKLFWNIDDNTKPLAKSRISTIDSLRGISIIGVVIIHSCYLLAKTEISVYEIINLSLINNLFRFVIPLFLFTSGLLLKLFIWTRKSIFEFYKSKFIRIVIPYFLVTLILYLIGYIENKSLLDLLITGEAAIPLYFVPLLLQMYLIYPILDYFRKINPNYLVKISILISVISYLLPFTWNFFGITSFFPYLIFFVYGMVRKNILYDKISPKWKELIYIYFIIQIFIIYRILSINIDNKFFDNITLSFYNTQFYFGFAMIFTLYKYLNGKNWISKKINHSMSSIGKISLWIFLIHFPIQEFIFNFIKFSNQIIFIQVIINTILTLIITVPISFLLNRVYSYFTRNI